MAGHLDGFEREYIFCIWPGNDKLPPDRAAEIFSLLANSHRAIVLLTPASIRKWELPEHPFHPAFDYLSECHQSDYLRVYIMHHYGGGYSDIKFTFKPWDGAFKALRESDAYALGYQFASPSEFGLSKKYQGSALLEEYKQHYVPFGIGHVAFIFKRYTPLTTLMLGRLHELLDSKLELLKTHPSRFQKDYLGRTLPDGSISQYPLDYIEMGPDVFHQALYEFREKIIHADIQPLHTFHFDLPNEDFRAQKRLFVERFIPSWPFS